MSKSKTNPDSEEGKWLQLHSRGCALALAAVGAGFVLRVVLIRGLGAELPPYVTLYPAVMVAALLGGLGPGLLATVAAAMLVAYWILPPQGFRVEGFTNLVGLVLFMSMGVFMSVVADLYRRSRHKAAAKERELVLLESDRQRKIAEAVEAERKRFHEVLNMLPAYVVLLSPDYRVPFANRFFEERFGKSNGKRCFEYLFNRGEPCENCETYKVLKTNAPHEWEWTGPDGNKYEIHDYPFKDTDGSPMILEVGIDVTARRQAEAALSAERQRFYDVLETLPTMLCLLTPDYHVAFANRSFRERFGESQGRHCYEYCFGCKEPCDFCESYNVLKTGQPHHWEVKRPDGSVIEAHDFPFLDVDGSPMILEMDVDVTETRKAQEALKEANDRLEQRVAERTAALRESEERIRQAHERTETILRSITDAFFALDREWRFSYVNAQAERLLKKPAVELLGSNVWMLFPGAEAFRTRYEGAVASGEAVAFEEYYAPLARWFEVHAYPSPDGLSVYFRDATERKRAEQALFAAKQRLEAVMRAVPVGVSFSDDETCQRITGNPEVLAQFEVTQQDNLSASAPDAGAPGRQVRFFRNGQPIKDTDLPLQRAVAENRAIAPMELEVRLPSGKRWFTEASGAPIRGADGKVIGGVAVTVDITERKRADDELRQAQEQLRRHAENLEQIVQERTAKLQELVGDLEHFSYTLVHDMRAPLRTMRGFAEMMTEECGGCSNEQPRAFLGRIMTSAERMDALITDALNFTKAVRQELPLEPVDVMALLRGMLDSYPELQPSKANIDIEGEIPRVMGNQAGLTQCFSNLLGNAVKFVAPGVRPHVRIRAETRPYETAKNGPPPGLFIRLWFEDNGIGIPAEALGRVFDMFHRAHRDYEGTGIGLALVRKVAQRMGGRVGVESQEGKGSKFWIELRAYDITLRSRP